MGSDCVFLLRGMAGIEMMQYIAIGGNIIALVALIVTFVFLWRADRAIENIYSLLNVDDHNAPNG